MRPSGGCTQGCPAGRADGSGRPLCGPNRGRTSGQFEIELHHAANTGQGARTRIRRWMPRHKQEAFDTAGSFQLSKGTNAHPFAWCVHAGGPARRPDARPMNMGFTTQTHTHTTLPSSQHLATCRPHTLPSGSANLASHLRPSMTCSEATAVRASLGLAKVTKPKPRDLPEYRSRMIWASSTAPYWEKWRVSAESSVCHGTLGGGKGRSACEGTGRGLHAGK